MKYLKPLELYHESLKLNSRKLLGVWVLESIYLALSDDEKKTTIQISGLGKTKTRKGAGVAQLQILQNLISKCSVSGLVISYPFEREWGLPTAGVQTKRFVDDLTKSGKFEGINYTFWDETLKSMVRERMLERIRSHGSALLDVPDHAYAWEILQGYLDFFDKNHDQTTFEGEHGHLRPGAPKLAKAHIIE